MKITGKPHTTPTFPGSTITSSTREVPADLKPRRRSNTNTPRFKTTPVRRLTRTRTRTRAQSRPGSPFLEWKVDDNNNEGGKQDKQVLDEEGRGRNRKGVRRVSKVVSARKLAAGLWRLQLPDNILAGAGSNEERRRRSRRRSRDRLGFQLDAAQAGVSFLPRRSGKADSSEVKDPLQSSSSVSDAKSKFFCKVEPSFQFSNTAMEGATKWHPVCLETLDEAHQIYSRMKRLDHQVTTVSMISALEAELEHARARIQELEDERRSSKKKMEHFLKKVSEERAAWRSREHEKIRAFIDDVKTDLNRERKNRQRLEIVNSKLVNELADAKVSAKRFKQDYEKERKDRELIEEVCDELAKEIGEDKAEVEALKRDSMKLREEVDEERKMLQMAEVWREERVQMKLVDAKVALETKYSQMNRLVADLETFLRSKSTTPDLKEMNEVESLLRDAASVDIQDVKEFKYEPANPDDIFSVFEEVNCCEPNEREIETCVACSPVSHASKIHTVSPEVVVSKNGNHRHCNALYDQNGEIEEDESGWETVSHLEDQGSSYSAEGSVPSVNDKNHRDSNISRSGIEWEENACDETPVTEISELCSVPMKQYKKVSSIAKLWRSGGDNYKIVSVNGLNGRISNVRKSNGAIVSPDRGSGKSGFSPDLVEQWSSPDSGDPRGMKGCIEWPRGAPKGSLKAKLMEARMESQKVQLRHVLKQKI